MEELIVKAEDVDIHNTEMKQKRRVSVVHTTRKRPTTNDNRRSTDYTDA